MGHSPGTPRSGGLFWRVPGKSKGKTIDLVALLDVFELIVEVFFQDDGFYVFLVAKHPAIAQFRTCRDLRREAENSLGSHQTEDDANP